LILKGASTSYFLKNVGQFDAPFFFNIHSKIYSMENIDFKDKKVLVRVDFNVPLDENGKITDDTRMVKALPVIKKILEGGGSVILMSHLGRPLKKLNSDGSIDKKKFTLQHLELHLEELTGTQVLFVDDCIGEEAALMASRLEPGQILLLENTRFHEGETKGDREMAEKLAGLGDLYINNAFGTAHRAHASTAVIADFFTKDHMALGDLILQEIDAAKKVMYSPARPMTAIIGGAKVSDKIQLISRLIEKANNIIIGGGMAYTFFKAKGGEIGNSLVENDFLDLALELIEKAKKNNVEIFLPVDSRIADSFSNEAKLDTCPSGEIPEGWMGLDIGPKAEEDFKQVILNSKTILWNGPLGVFEFSNFANGTFSIAQAVADATEQGAYSLIGGGDSVAAINKAGLGEQVSFISTGGGAMLEYLEGKDLPGITAITD
jgi:phosphoglycerate kinase